MILKRIIIWKKENNEVDKTLKEINDLIKPIEKENNENVEIIEPNKENVPKTDPFWKFVDMNLLYVDFSELKTINSKTIGWIEVKGTNVNLPYVQANDNEYFE